MYLGIDLGSTFSLASFVNPHGVPVLVPDLHNAGEFRTPSVAHVSGKQALVGHTIEEQLLDEPGLPIVRGFKQAMGVDACAYRDSEGHEWPPEALSALILRKLLNDVEMFATESVEHCVITVPANFNDAQRRATRAAAHLAGLSRVQLVEEPIAAAAFHGFNEKSAEQTLFVYDFGGGTFDATVLQISGGRVHVLATDGHNGLGGRRIDDALVEAIAQDFQLSRGIGDAAGREQLRKFAEDAKLAIATGKQHQVRKTMVVGGKVIEFTLSREQLDGIVLPVVEETIAVCRRCLEGAALSWNLIDAILTTGGSSLLPQVSQRLAQESGKPASTFQNRHPHQAVAYGAAVIAQAQADGGESQPLNAVAPYHLGLRVRDPVGKGHRIEPLIKRNTPLPARHSATFYTTRADQNRLVLDVVQSKGDGDLVASLGHFVFGPISRPRKNYPVEVTLAYDSEGLVRVTAKDLLTGHALDRELSSDGDPDSARITQGRNLLRGIRIN